MDDGCDGWFFTIAFVYIEYEVMGSNRTLIRFYQSVVGAWRFRFDGRTSDAYAHKRTELSCDCFD